MIHAANEGLSLVIIFVCLLIIAAFLQIFFPASQDDPKDKDDE